MSDKDIIEVDHDISGQDKVLENVVHHGLEGCGRVGKPKVHHQRFEKSTVGTECSFPLIALTDADIVEPPSDIEFREESGPFQTINKIVNERDRIPVLYGHRVQCPIVLDEPKLPILLLYQEDWGSHRRFRRSDPAGG